jgi:large subunit ribosomal protein L3
MVPVTVIDVAGNTFAQKKTQEKDGYTAIQVAFDAQKESRLSKPVAGHLKKLGVAPAKVLKEFRVDASELPAEGAEHPGVNLFTDGQWVDVIGTSKGKGFQGAMRRHNFHGSPAAHGSMMHRRTGSVGACSTPGRVWKGQKMPGQHGNFTRTVQNLKVVQVRPEDNVILISGAVPGARGSYLVIRPAKKKQAK